jgi:PPOX class probable F420-dependent enzyme
VRFDLADLDGRLLRFLTEHHLGTLTTLRPDGSPHVAPVGFCYDGDARLVRIITFERAQKVRNLDAGGGRVAVSQVDGRRWVTLEGEARVVRDPASVAAAVAAYSARYRTPGERPDRVAIEIVVDRAMGSV